MIEKYYCGGCGSLLQDQNKDELGYIPKFDQNKEVNYCKRCYNLIFRNERPNLFLNNQDYWDLFEEIVIKKQTYILVLDLFNVEGSIIPKMVEKLKDTEVILVLNKRDLFPKLVSNEKIIQNILKNKYLKNLRINKTIITSTKNKSNIDELLNTIKNYSNNRNMYIIGAANVGKSSLVNALINAVAGENLNVISTSYYAGTTLSLINIPINEKYDLIDTPGIINTQDLTTQMDKKILEVIIPKTEIRPRTYQLNNEQTLFITGFAQLDFIKGYSQGFTIYVSNQVNIHRSKLENSKDVRNRNLGKELLFPPDEKTLKNLKFKTYDIEINYTDLDLVIEGLGWINFKNVKKSLFLKLTLVSGINYHIRKNII